MGSRYWVTGVQLGLLFQANNLDREKVITKITNEQYIGDKKDFEKQFKKVK